MNRIQHKNLKIYLAWLKAGNITQEQFDMALFKRYKNKRKITNPANPLCGTIGCMLGWAPHCVPISALDFGLSYNMDTMYKFFNYTSYSTRVFGINFLSTTWEFLFGAQWEHYDNTLEGAIGRLEFLVENPDFFEGDL